MWGVSQRDPRGGEGLSERLSHELRGRCGIYPEQKQRVRIPRGPGHGVDLGAEDEKGRLG